MGRASIVQNAFNAGEFSPQVAGRFDLKKYPAALKTCFNAVPLVQGGWTRRSGTKHITQVKYNSRATRLIPFQYSTTQTYVLEFGHNYVRFFPEHRILTTSARSITGITKANPAVLTYSGTDIFANGDRVYIDNMDAGMTQVNFREFVVTNLNTGSNTFELYDTDGNAVNSTAYDTFTVGGSVQGIYEVTTTYTEAELFDIRVTQSADTLFITHPDHPPRKLARNSATSWTLSDLDLLDGPYGAINTTTTTLSPSAATGTVTLTASAVTGINTNQGFLSTDVGRLVRLEEGTTWGYAKILTVGSTVSVTANVLSTLTNTNAKVNWRLGVFSDTTGWPTCSTFHEDRLWLAGAATTPQRLDGSKSGAYTDFAPSATNGTVADDNAVAFTLNTDDVNAVKWMASNERGLLVGTARSEWNVRPSTQGEAITPTNISGKPSTRRGSADVPPVIADKAVLFVQRSGRKLREMAYVYEIDGFRSPDMTMLAEHVTRPSIIDTAYQEQPQAVVWAARSDGVLLGMTYERDQDVVAWHRHEIGGYSNAGHTAAALVESVACVPSPDGTTDDLYMVVKRYINGRTRRYVEYMTKIWEDGDTQAAAFYTDCGRAFTNGSPSTAVSSLWHLEGETVGVYIDGKTHPNATVTNGKITLDTAATTVTIGYFYNSDGETLTAEGGSQDGNSLGKIGRIARVGFLLFDTLGLKYGPDEDNLTEILSRDWGATMGDATALATGIVRPAFEGDYDRTRRVFWRADGPFPATVLAVMLQLEVSDDS